MWSNYKAVPLAEGLKRLSGLNRPNRPTLTQPVQYLPSFQAARHPDCIEGLNNRFCWRRSAVILKIAIRYLTVPRQMQQLGWMEGDLINLQQNSEVADDRAGAEIYIRLAASELELQIGNGSTRTGNIKRTIRTTLAVAILTTLITFGLFMYFRCLRKGKLVHRGTSWFFL
ncbi:hypothetical protein D5086_009745 [Populus alba]|uniref:Uncharacterized protein n=1 Tax=Populus alba TaxID=43335 RepID=A0ACC4C9A2_POPAL